jgi:hypothetical protein
VALTIGRRIIGGPALVALAATLVALLAAAPAARAAELTCPATFHVLHDDRIGKLKLPQGHYTITVLDDRRLRCGHASDLFRQFLEDYDGNLPGHWRVVPARSEFLRGRGEVGFRVAPAGSPSGGGGRHPATGRACPSFFDVLHNDRIGRLRLPKGKYRITLLAVRRLSCSEASSLFTRFLEDWNGRLPGRWRLDVKTATFSKSLHVGFRVKRAVGPDPNPNQGGQHPSGTGKRCPATFRVLHNDRIGRLKLPEGNYRITRLSRRSPGCTRASKLFARFLQHPQGDLPGRWRVDPQSASFTKGGTRNGFRVKLVR